jgi:DNA-binding CsgD family transcriptional regulator
MKPENSSFTDYDIKILSLMLEQKTVKEIALIMDKKVSSMYHKINRIHLLLGNPSKCNFVLKHKWNEYLKVKNNANYS